MVDTFTVRMQTVETTKTVDTFSVGTQSVVDTLADTFLSPFSDEDG